MANVREIQGRIKSVQNIQQITRAMKMIAAVRIKRIERLLKSRRPYCKKLFEILNEIMSQLDEITHPLMEVREPHNVGLVVITGDKGLCGTYNMNVIRRAEKFIEELKEQGRKLTLYVVGSKAYRYFDKRNYAFEKHYYPWEPTQELAEDLTEEFTTKFIDGTFDELHCIYTESISMITQRVKEEQLLPLKGSEETEGKNAICAFEPEPEVALNAIMPMFLNENIMRILLDTKTSELSARINAMSNATDNAEKLVGELKLNYYRARQDSITTEILEIVSGAEALKAG